MTDLWVQLVVFGLAAIATGITWYKLAQRTEAARIQAEEDRLLRQRVILLLDRLDDKAVINAASNARIEAAAVIVATELAASQDRADAIDGPDGAAADAASKSGDAPTDPPAGS